MRVACNLTSVYVFRRQAAGPDFLLVRRAAADYMGGTWATGYGQIAEGETALQAALREMAEETGLVPARLYHAGSVETFYIPEMDTIFHCPIFAAEVGPEAVVRLNDEHEAFEWVSPEIAVQRLVYPGQRRSIRHILTEIIEAGPTAAYLEVRFPV